MCFSLSAVMSAEASLLKCFFPPRPYLHTCDSLSCPLLIRNESQMIFATVPDFVMLNEALKMLSSY